MRKKSREPGSALGFLLIHAVLSYLRTRRKERRQLDLALELVLAEQRLVEPMLVPSFP